MSYYKSKKTWVEAGRTPHESCVYLLLHQELLCHMTYVTTSSRMIIRQFCFCHCCFCHVMSFFRIFNQNHNNLKRYQLFIICVHLGTGWISVSLRSCLFFPPFLWTPLEHWMDIVVFFFSQSHLIIHVSLTATCACFCTWRCKAFKWYKLSHVGVFLMQF